MCVQNSICFGSVLGAFCRGLELISPSARCLRMFLVHLVMRHLQLPLCHATIVSVIARQFKRILLT